MFNKILPNNIYCKYFHNKPGLIILLYDNAVKVNTINIYLNTDSNIECNIYCNNIFSKYF